MIKAEKGSVMINGSPDDLHKEMIGILMALKRVGDKLQRAWILSSIAEVMAGVAPEGECVMNKTVTVDKEELRKQMEEEKGNA